MMSAAGAHGTGPKGVPTTSDAPSGAVDEPMSLRAKVAAAAVTVVVLLLAVAAFLRFSSPVIPPRQTPPRAHYPLPCPVCHTMSANAPLIEAR